MDCNNERYFTSLKSKIRQKTFQTAKVNNRDSQKKRDNKYIQNIQGYQFKKTNSPFYLVFIMQSTTAPWTVYRKK